MDVKLEPRRFKTLTPREAATFYQNRPISQLPTDLLQACNELRAQQRDINTLRSQLLRARVKNTLLVALLGGAAAKGIEVAVVALLHIFAH